MCVCRMRRQLKMLRLAESGADISSGPLAVHSQVQKPIPVSSRRSSTRFQTGSSPSPTSPVRTLRLTRWSSASTGRQIRMQTANFQSTPGSQRWWQRVIPQATRFSPCASLRPRACNSLRRRATLTAWSTKCRAAGTSSPSPARISPQRALRRSDSSFACHGCFLSPRAWQRWTRAPIGSSGSAAWTCATTQAETGSTGAAAT
mmetsp:Transcript_2906/g.8883  ORF Transcript_2906/g.8883 Transcript_2906/m.8883 type:complete len:203 (-) Transcript_2906:675-1283(-)